MKINFLQTFLPSTLKKISHKLKLQFQLQQFFYRNISIFAFFGKIQHLSLALTFIKWDQNEATSCSQLTQHKHSNDAKFIYLKLFV